MDIQATLSTDSSHFFVSCIVKRIRRAKMTDEEELVLEQLNTFGMMKFPKDFMNIGEKRFDWVYENRTEWVRFTEKWETASGLFKFWYMYVKLRESINKKNDQPAAGASDKSADRPVYTVPLDK